MGRFVGFTASKGTIPIITVVPTTEFDRATGITTDSNNQVTSVILGNVEYGSILYNNVGLITSYTETIGGISKNFVLNYDSDYSVSSITEV